VVVDRVSIGVRINQLIDRLQAASGPVAFESCFELGLPEVELRHQAVVTLLAMLELARLRAVRVLQPPGEETLFIIAGDGTALETARQAEITSAADAEETPPS
jgi:hypothetical protein